MTSVTDRVEAIRPAASYWLDDPVEPDSELLLQDETPPVEEVPSLERAPASWPARLFASLLILLGLAWIGFCAFSLSRAWPGASPAAWAGWAATATGPLILLSLLWLIFGRSSRRESEKFLRAVAAMRRENDSLDRTIESVSARLDANRVALADQTAGLMALAEEASDRLGRVTHYLSRESAELDRKSQALETAGAAARIDIGALLADLPLAEASARDTAEAMKAAGLAAHEQAAALDGKLAALDGHAAALTARSQEADETAGGAAQRLAAMIARIETGTGAAVAAIDAASAHVDASVDASLGRAAESIDQLRSGLDAQGQALLATVETGRAAFVEAGAEAAATLTARIEEAGRAIEEVSVRLAGQDRVSQAMLDGLTARLGEAETRLLALGEAGETETQKIASSLEVLHEVVTRLGRGIAEGGQTSETLTARTHEMSAALDELSTRLRSELPAALTEVQAQTLETGAAASAAVSAVEAIRDAAGQAASNLAAGEKSVENQRGNLDAILARVAGGVAEAEGQLRALTRVMEESGEAADRITRESSPALIEALIRVRETAAQAAAHARAAIAEVIPESAAALANASREALGGTIADAVQDQLSELGAASQRAMAVARQASERLTRQLLTIGETATAIEERLSGDRNEREAKAEENLGRQVSLMIEALNSASIDVSKILSNEVSDSAWAAYLKGERGVFTRRAVRLLDSGEAREILRHYEEEPEFRDAVNRYVHDFEAMLRRILTDRDSGSLSVTLLSSDVGKLYVALAQSIERLR